MAEIQLLGAVCVDWRNRVCCQGSYRRHWLLSTCAYNCWQQGNMRLTADVRLTRNSRSINGCENSGWGFRCFRYIARSTWQSVISWPWYLQADLAAACRRDTNLRRGGGQQPLQIRCQSPQGCYCRCSLVASQYGILYGRNAIITWSRNIS